MNLMEEVMQIHEYLLLMSGTNDYKMMLKVYGDNL